MITQTEFVKAVKIQLELNQKEQEKTRKELIRLLQKAQDLLEQENDLKQELKELNS